jgi:Tfp pilus assembly protein PilF
MSDAQKTQEPSRRPRRQSRSKRRRQWLVLAVIECIIIAIAAFPFLKSLKQWRASRQNASQVNIARSHMERQDWGLAANVLIEALRQSPDDPDVLHALAQLLKSAQADPRELEYYLQRLADSGLATPKELTDLAGANVRQGDLESARQALERLPASERSNSDALTIEAAMLKAQNRQDDAEALLRKALEKEAGSDSEALFKIAVLDFKKEMVRL